MLMSGFKVGVESGKDFDGTIIVLDNLKFVFASAVFFGTSEIEEILLNVEWLSG